MLNHMDVADIKMNSNFDMKKIRSLVTFLAEI